MCITQAHVSVPIPRTAGGTSAETGCVKAASRSWSVGSYLCVCTYLRMYCTLYAAEPAQEHQRSSVCLCVCACVCGGSRR